MAGKDEIERLRAEVETLLALVVELKRDRALLEAYMEANGVNRAMLLEIFGEPEDDVIVEG